MKIKPLGERIVVKPMKQEQKTKGGIYLPDTASKEKPQQGEVIAVGPDFKGVKVGDKVLFAKYGGTEVKMDEEEYLVLGEDDVLAVLEE
ncbi:co-chaperone GroES [Candidatus Aerophobetes bacterium]|uniref:Co-chaperonin GroES n=1 Tax=Aerophobetes bacterium TaxID=2030807 RepID=A0A497E6R0_UNCAE|nr:co-chaperone GroES [Candidatus Aerophobetes bacterium]RLE10050.1 MAG: co-chaperone GroES [Candidatus Aerophobetes bacterium]